jgi:hypothetical protein
MLKPDRMLRRHEVDPIAGPGPLERPLSSSAERLRHPRSTRPALPDPPTAFVLLISGLPIFYHPYNITNSPKPVGHEPRVCTHE